MHTKLTLVVCLVSSVPALAQSAPAAANETGAVNFYFDSGWSFGLPANRAIAQLGNVTAISPEKKTLVAPSFGVTVTAWKYLVPFFDVGGYSAGKATASVGTVRSEVEGDIWTFNGGLRLVGGRSKVRPYAEFGGGVLYQKPTFTLTVGNIVSTANPTTTMGNVMYGAGLQTFFGRRWGADMAFDGFHAMQSFAQGGQNFSRIRIGIFFQTKSAIP